LHQWKLYGFAAMNEIPSNDDETTEELENNEDVGFVAFWVVLGMMYFVPICAIYCLISVIAKWLGK
jgi:hypothetical protein